MSEHILQQVHAGVLHLQISRRDKKNSLTRAMYLALAEALVRASADAQLRVVLISGQDDLFTAGNDVADFLVRQPGEVSAGMRFIQAIAAFDKPLIAAVGGNAIGIGTTMLLHCDLVYAADNAQFKLPFVPLGLCPEACSSLLLPRLAGHQRAAELLFFGEGFDAQYAAQIGLVNALCRREELLALATARAEKLARLPREALMSTKALMKQPLQAQLPAVMEAEIKRFGELATSPTAREIFNAFLEKRAPDFSQLPGGQP